MCRNKDVLKVNHSGSCIYVGHIYFPTKVPPIIIKARTVKAMIMLNKPFFLYLFDYLYINIVKIDFLYSFIFIELLYLHLIIIFIVFIK